MYEAYWGLRSAPYGDLDGTEGFYTGPVREEALARLRFVVEHAGRSGLLLGHSGIGKTRLLAVFRDQLAQQGTPVVLVDLAGIDAPDLLWQLATQWGVPVRRQATHVELWRQVTDRLGEFRYTQTTGALLLDNVDQASDEVQSLVIRLAHGPRAAHARLAIVFSAASDTLAQIDGRLLERAMLRVDLAPWDAVETKQFIEAGLARVGRTSPAFADEAVLRICELSQGIPRRVAQLAELALLAGASGQADQIDPDMVEGVYQELLAA